jgi:hypothetical protein
MRLILRLLCILLLGMFCFWLGMEYDDSFNSGNYPISVTIRNESGQGLKSLILVHYGTGIKGRLDIEPPTNNGFKVVRFYQPGESSFEVEATLENGRELTGIGGYIEPGYDKEMVITATDIRNK